MRFAELNPKKLVNKSVPLYLD